MAFPVSHRDAPFQLGTHVQPRLREFCWNFGVCGPEIITLSLLGLGKEIWARIYESVAGLLFRRRDEVSNTDQANHQHDIAFCGILGNTLVLV
jgi:hypothetical protein